MDQDWMTEARRLLDEEGASYREVARTVGVSRWTIERHLPGRGWTSVEGGRFGNAVRRANQVLRMHRMKP